MSGKKCADSANLCYFKLSNHYITFVRFGNVKARYVPRPELVSRFYRSSNCVDMLNQLREDGLRLEKQWVTRDGYFRMCTGLTGMTLVDVYKLGQFHGILPRGKLLLGRLRGL